MLVMIKKSTIGHVKAHYNTAMVHAGSVPMVLTIDVHPPGIYSIRFVSSTGDEDTVTYNITDIKTDGK